MALLKKNLLERSSSGHILDVSVNANSFCVQCSVMASAVLTRGVRVEILNSEIVEWLTFHI